MYGVDVGEEAVAAAAARGHRTVVSDIAALPFADDAFDYISLSHVLEHGTEPVEALREVRRVLKSGGVAQVVVPNADSWGARHYGKAWRAWDVPRHLYHFDPVTLRKAAERAGLRVMKLKTLPDAWILEESRKAVGEEGAARRARDDGNVCVWCGK
jgi:ubiquinone/menaquinone biosynthesis C-methylase UbiE